MKDCNRWKEKKRREIINERKERKSSRCLKRIATWKEKRRDGKK